MNFMTLSDKGMVRPNNEDYAESFQHRWCDANGHIDSFTGLILADGMGGAAAGEFASMMAVKTIKLKVLDAMFNHPFEEFLASDFRGFLSQGYSEANKTVYDKSVSDPEMQGMGCTLVTVLIAREMMTVAHVGDSRCYLLREGKFRPLTRDHSLVQELLDQGKINAEQAKKHPNKNVITKAIGVAPAVEPDAIRLPIFSGDVLLLCSDGLSGFAEETSIIKILTEQTSDPRPDLKKVAQTLIELANFNGGGDNISVCLYKHSSF